MILSGTKKYTIAYILGFLGSITALALTSLSASALPNDHRQPITLQSDQAEFDRINSTTTYSGSVIMEQGSMQIKAEKVIIYGDANSIVRIIAEGTPAQFKQTPEVDSKPVTASGNVLEYNVDEKVLYLLENASLKQEGAILTGPKITYNVEQAVVQAGQTDQKNGDSRIRMVIPPSTEE